MSYIIVLALIIAFVTGYLLGKNKKEEIKLY